MVAPVAQYGETCARSTAAERRVKDEMMELRGMHKAQKSARCDQSQEVGRPTVDLPRIVACDNQNVPSHTAHAHHRQTYRVAKFCFRFSHFRGAGISTGGGLDFLAKSKQSPNKRLSSLSAAPRSRNLDVPARYYVYSVTRCHYASSHACRGALNGDGLPAEIHVLIRRLSRPSHHPTSLDAVL